MGGVIGGVLAAAVIVFGLIVVYRKFRKPSEPERDVVNVNRLPPPEPYVWVPPNRSTTMREGPAGGLVQMSSKEREYRYRSSPDVLAGQSSMSRSMSMGASESTSSRARSSDALSPTEVVELRTEVEQLRRVMQTIRVQQIERPPSYAV